MWPVANVVELDAVNVVLRQAFDHQVALEATHFGLAEVVPERSAGPVVDDPARVLVQHVPRARGAVSAVDEPGMDLDVAPVTLLDEVAERIVSGLNAVAHGAQVAAVEHLAAPVPDEHKDGVEMGAVDLRDQRIGLGGRFDLRRVHPDTAQLSLRGNGREAAAGKEYGQQR